MTLKQKDRIENKIRKIKEGLAADKRFWKGYYHDGSGSRYMPPRLYIDIEDYRGGLRYIRGFNKNFPDDARYPEFDLECAVILFKSRKYDEAEAIIKEGLQ